MNKEQEWLDERLAYWQGQLGLTNWTIEVHYEREKDFHKQGRLGEVWDNSARMLATVLLLDRIDYDPNDWKKWSGGYDEEVTLVHELLHVLLWWIPSPYGTVKGSLLERSIDVLSWKLVEMDRRGRTGA